MPVEIKGEFINAKELDAILLGLSKEYGPRNALVPVRAAARTTLKRVAPTLAAATPVVSGSLRDSIRVSTAKVRGSGALVTASVGYLYPRGKGAVPRVPQGLGVEFGSLRNKRPRMPIRTTFRRVVPIMNKTMARELSVAIQRAVQRWTRARGKGKFRYR